MIFHITFNGDGTVTLPDGEKVGVVGEHNATSLEITLPEAMVTDIDYCVAAFQVGLNTVRSEPIYEAESGTPRRSGTKVYLDMWEQVTACPKVTVQLEAYRTVGGEAVRVAKTVPTKELTIVPGVCGGESAFMSEPSLAARLSAQLHDNFETLDALSEADGVLTLGGESYSPASHNHDGEYAAIDHDHDSDYAALGHSHDADYAELGHLHDGIYQRSAAGFGLSENNLDDELKSNYDSAYVHAQSVHAPPSAQENILESVKVNGTALTLGTGKSVDIALWQRLPVLGLSSCTVDGVASPAVNRRYIAEVSGALVFSLPTPASPLEENVITVYATVASGVPVTWGAAGSILYYNGEIPCIGEGSFEFIFVYNPSLSKWTVGVLPVAGVSA